MTRRLTAEERARLRALHERFERKDKPGEFSCIYCCRREWPCPTVALLDEVEELQEKLNAER